MTTSVGRRDATARLRPKNQLTIPEAVVRTVGAEIGDRFRVETDGDSIRLIPVRKSYFGALKGLWPDNWMEELREERDSWSRREQP